jgi:phytol kinase
MDGVETNILISEVIRVVINFIVAFIGGLLVRHKRIKTNYTRKINHFTLFFLPVFISNWFPYEESVMTTVLGLAVSIAFLTMYIKPFRDRVGIIQIAFLSFDRPEDRPHTLLWLSTQFAASFFVLIPVMIYLDSVGKISLLLIPILVNGIGDGLAEPVGVRFGMHTYKTYALFSKKKYVRSIEGSACVFVTGIFTVRALYSSFSPNQFIAALIVIPIIMTMAEAMHHIHGTARSYTRLAV